MSYPKVIAIAQEKGGNCKTTTAVNFSLLLTRKGHKTLLIDADQQANATDTFHAQYEGVSTLYDVINDGANINECIQHTDVGDIVAGDPLLRELKTKLASLGIPGLRAFKDAIVKLEGYEYVVIDCPPDMSIYLQSIFVATTEIIVPMLAARYSLIGINHLLETVNNVRILNPELKIAGLLLCKFSGRNIADRNVLLNIYDIAERSESRVFNTYIRETSKTREAELSKTPVIDYAPNVQLQLTIQCLQMNI